MSTISKIQWTDRTWNPVRGCALVSEGCRNCYAMKQAHRFAGPWKPYARLTRLGKHGPTWTGRARFVPEMLDQPLRWKAPARVFVNSMSDLFHEDLTNEEIAAVFGAMTVCSRHTFQILTKRAERMREWFEWIKVEGIEVCRREFWQHTNRAGMNPWEWPLQNVWLGVSVEDQKHANERIPELLETPAAVRFISAEPLLGPVDLEDWFDPCAGPCGLERVDLDWVIVGGESGPGARECRESWIRAIVDECDEAGVACFVKQMGARAVDDVTWRGSEPDYHFADRKGGNPEEWPAALRVRQYPETTHG